MATLFTAFFATVAKGAAAIGGAASAATGAVGGSGALTFLSGLSTVVGGLASISAGRQQEAALEAQAQDEELRASQETLNGREVALNAMKKLNDDMAAITVAGYASGLASSGSVEAAQREAQQVGEANMASARENSRFAAAARRGQARQLRVEGAGARQQGLFGAIQGGLSLFSRGVQRG